MRRFLFLLCIPFTAIAQTDYELVFNSATLDYVEMTNASTVIANKTAFSMSCWVYPEANTNHGGIIGFRNNTDADFYLLQLQNTNNIEARFRGSSGVNYDIVASNALDFNQWQHLAFTYDGSYICLYKDGIIVDSTAANGIITQTTVPFMLGALDWQGSLFHLNGSLDEIRLWDVALSQTEIHNWMCDPLNATHPNYNNLMGYWRLNEGTGTSTADLSPNGNNGILTNNPIWQTTTSCFGATTPALTYVPDDEFEAYLEANGMGNNIPNDSNVFTSAIDTVTSLVFGNLGISDLTGIEAFIALTHLDCSGNFLTSLNLINNTALTDLDCSANQLTSLDISQNTALTKLACYSNQLTSLDVSGATALTDLLCYNNQLTSLDVSQHTALTYLYCSVNQITSLDVSNNIALTYLVCDNNQLTSLDVSNNTALTELFCYYNQLTSLDVSQNTALTYLYCSVNQLTSLDVSQNTALTILRCDNNQLTSLDLSNNIALTELFCYYNQLTSLDASQNTALIWLNCESNLLTTLNVRNGNNISLAYFYAYNNIFLYCIDVDDPSWATINWIIFNGQSGNIDSQHYFSTNCSGTSIEEHTTNKKLLKVTDLLGRETKAINQSLFYIYDDGTVENRIIIE